jgi:hypothetical protein
VKTSRYDSFASTTAGDTFASEYATAIATYPNAVHIVAGSHRDRYHTTAQYDILRDLGAPSNVNSIIGFSSPEWILVGEPGLGAGNAYGWVFQNYSTDPTRVAHLNMGLPIYGGTDNYLEFDGTDEYITLPTFTYTPYCLDFWVYNNTQITANNGSVGGPSTYQTLFRNLSGLQLSLGGWTSLMTNETLHIYSGGKYTYINETIPSGLHNWVYNWNGSNFDIWVDGVKKTAIAGSTGHATLAEQSSSNYLGYNAGSYYFYGKIYGMKIYTSQLSDDKVLQNFNAQRGRFGI